MAKKIGVRFPFADGTEGELFKLTTTSDDAIKSDLIHLLLTNKGERFYMPDFGANLRKYLFEPIDGITSNDIKNEVQNAVRKYIPNLQINEITVAQNSDNDPSVYEYTFNVKIDYTVTEDAFATKDTITLKL